MNAKWNVNGTSEHKNSPQFFPDIETSISGRPFGSVWWARNGFNLLVEDSKKPMALWLNMVRYTTKTTDFHVSNP
jgi:hypothetical protein